MRPLRSKGLFLIMWTCCWMWLTPLPASALDSPLRIASFNIQVFGASKVKNSLVTPILTQIISRYDLVLVQEIRDADNSAIYQLLDMLNEKNAGAYGVLLSDRLGRTVSKEQYAYIYKADRVTPLDHRTYHDASDRFEREPFIGYFAAGETTFSVIGIHVTPRAVKEELQALNEVYRDVKTSYGDSNILAMGDFNADCSYYNPRQGFQYFDDEAHEIIPAKTDTTVAQGLCTYDRVLAFGALSDKLSDGSAFNFQKAYGLSAEDTKLISDHYPIEFTLNTSGENQKASAAASQLSTPGSKPQAPAVSQVRPPINPPATQLPVIPAAASAKDAPGLAQCGDKVYATPKGYCYGMQNSTYVRVSSSCCPLSATR